MDAIGFVECRYIAGGYAVADAMLKAADVRMVFARKQCPGRFHILVSGETAAVFAAVDTAKAQDDMVLDTIVLPRVDAQVVNALGKRNKISSLKAVGIMEFSHVVSSVCGADAAVKAADVKLLTLCDGGGINGKSFFVIEGEVAAVQAAANAAAAAAESHGKLLSRALIPNPHPELIANI